MTEELVVRPCITPGHEKRESKVRGLCYSCYAAAAKNVKRGLVTWEQLEKAGKCEVPCRKEGLSSYFLDVPKKKGAQSLKKKEKAATEPPKTEWAAEEVAGKEI